MADRDRRAHDHPAARRHARWCPARRRRPFPGISAKVVDDEGNELADDSTGLLVLTEPWPSMLRTIWGDDDRYVDTYWSRFGKNVYFAGDGAKKDADGNIWLLGRVDDVMNVSGHRISTTEVESSLVGHPSVAEAAVVGASDPTTGQGIVAFVILRESGTDSGDELVQTLRNHVGPRHRPDRQAAADHGRAGAAQDPLGQDHAAAAPRHRGEPGARRRHHAHRLLGDEPDQGEAARRAVRGLKCGTGCAS